MEDAFVLLTFFYAYDIVMKNKTFKDKGVKMMIKRSVSDFFKNRNTSFYIILCFLLVAFLCTLSAVVIPPVRERVQWIVNGEKSIYYINGTLAAEGEEITFEENDVREIQTLANGRKNLINHAYGYALSFPGEATFDFSAAKEFVTVQCENCSVVFSKEWTTFREADKTKQYVAENLHKYILNETFQKENNIELHKNETLPLGNYEVQTVALSRVPQEGSRVLYNTYVYCYIYNHTNTFYRLMFKAAEYNDALLKEVTAVLNSFTDQITPQGVAKNATDYKPIENANWNEETRAFYRELLNAEQCKWGIFQPDAVKNNDFTALSALEKELGAWFEGVLEYQYHTNEVPVSGMQTAYERGKVIELTLQTSTLMNWHLEKHTPVFDILDGAEEKRLRSIAGQIRDFSHPILFRLNNEMNSDWTSYGSSVCLTDPELYRQLWIYIYELFEEEGVRNAIWVFNPNDESFPPNAYNNAMAFYPGNGYVHVFGATGYNTGTYYSEQHGEKWRSFDEIYSVLTERYAPAFGEFPWIITEFASSSVGGEKPLWIRDMFQALPGYPHIKMAFWFNGADYDPKKETVAARPYWLNETPETTKAFSDGLKETKKKK